MFEIISIRKTLKSGMINLLFYNFFFNTHTQRIQQLALNIHNGIFEKKLVFRVKFSDS